LKVDVAYVLHRA